MVDIISGKLSNGKVNRAAPSQEKAGAHTLSLAQASLAGNFGQVLTSSNVAYPAAVPTQVTITSAQGNVGIATGGIAWGGSTDDTTPTLKGTLSAPFVRGEVLEIYGTLQDGPATLLGTADIGAGGTSWTFTPLAPLADGAHIFSTRVVDKTGNVLVGGNDLFGLKIDTVAPKQAVKITHALDDFGWTQGEFRDWVETDDVNPTLSGTLSAPLGESETLNIYDAGTFLGVATVTGANWTFTPTLPLVEGAHSFTARVRDAAGNLGPASADFEFDIDTAAPTSLLTITDVQDNVGRSKGHLQSGAISDDATPTLSGTLSVPLGEREFIRVWDAGTFLGFATVNGTSWTFTPIKPLAEGEHRFDIEVTDFADNPGPVSGDYLLTIDTVAPKQQLIMYHIDYSDTLSGTLSATLGKGESLGIYENDKFLGTASVSGTHWTFTPTGLAQGMHSLTARVSDEAGNIGRGDWPIPWEVPAQRTPPVVLDLNGDGAISYTKAQFDVDGNGVNDDTAWVGGEDGILFWDKQGDGKLHGQDQYAFGKAVNGTDLEGLAAQFDSNKDGMFDVLDTAFGQFKVWRDIDQNGKVDDGELLGLADVGITGIALKSDGQAFDPAAGVHVAGKTSALLADGSTMLIHDASFDYRPIG